MTQHLGTQHLGNLPRIRRKITQSGRRDSVVTTAASITNGEDLAQQLTLSLESLTRSTTTSAIANCVTFGTFAEDNKLNVPGAVDEIKLKRQGAKVKEIACAWTQLTTTESFHVWSSNDTPYDICNCKYIRNKRHPDYLDGSSPCIARRHHRALQFGP